MQLEDMIKKDKSFNWSDEEMGEDSQNERTADISQSEVVSSLKSRVQQRHSKKQKYKQQTA